MYGENNGKPYFKNGWFGENPLFLETPIYKHPGIQQPLYPLTDPDLLPQLGPTGKNSQQSIEGRPS